MRWLGAFWSPAITGITDNTAKCQTRRNKSHPSDKMGTDATNAYPAMADDTTKRGVMVPAENMDAWVTITG